MKDKNKIKGVVFDLGGVLVDNYGQEFLEYASKELKVSKSKLCEMIKKEESKLQQGKETTLEFWHRVCNKLKINPPSDKVLLTLKTKPYRKVKIKKDVLSLAREIKCPKAIFSNTIKEHAEINRKRKLFEYFDFVLLSNEVGFRKSQKEFYNLVSKRMNVPLENLLFIDDELRWVKAAKKYGARGLLFKSVDELKKDLGNVTLESGL